MTDLKFSGAHILTTWTNLFDIFALNVSRDILKFAGVEKLTHVCHLVALIFGIYSLKIDETGFDMDMIWLSVVGYKIFFLKSVTQTKATKRIILNIFFLKKIQETKHLVIWSVKWYRLTFAVIWKFKIPQLSSLIRTVLNYAVCFKCRRIFKEKIK